MKSLLAELRKELCDVLNKNPMGVDVKYYILKDVLREVSDAYHEYLAIPEEEPQKQEEEKELKEEELKEDEKNKEV